MRAMPIGSMVVRLLVPAMLAAGLSGCATGGAAGRGGLRWQHDRVVDGRGRVVRLKRQVPGQSRLEDEVLRYGSAGRVTRRLVRGAVDHSSQGCVRYDDNPGEVGPTCVQQGIVPMPLEWFEADDRYRHDDAGHPIERVRRQARLEGFVLDAPGSPGPRGSARVEVVRWGWRGDDLVSVRVVESGREVETATSQRDRLSEEALHIWALSRGRP